MNKNYHESYQQFMLERFCQYQEQQQYQQLHLPQHIVTEQQNKVDSNVFINSVPTHQEEECLSESNASISSHVSEPFSQPPISNPPEITKPKRGRKGLTHEKNWTTEETESLINLCRVGSRIFS